MRNFLFSKQSRFGMLFVFLFMQFSVFGQSLSRQAQLQLETQRAQQQSLLLNDGVFNGYFSGDGVNTACADAIPITSGNFTNMALTCGTTNDLNSNTVGPFCNDDGPIGGQVPTYYGDGNEALYSYTPSTDGQVTITVHSTTWAAIFVYDGCPTTGSCVTASRSTSATRSVTFNAIQGTEYFIWVDSWPAPASPCVEGGQMNFSGPEPATSGSSDEDCDQGDDSNGFENGYQIGVGTDFSNADDFMVSAGNTLNVKAIEINAISMNGAVSSMDFTFYEDNGGKPGAVAQTVTGLVPYAQNVIGAAFGYDVYAIYVDVDLNFDGGASGKTYWMQPTGHFGAGQTGGIFWEVTTAGSLGNPIHTKEAAGPWEPKAGFNGVFKLRCEHIDPPTPPCNFNISVSVEPISKVIFSDIDNSSSPVVGGSPALEDFTSIVGHLELEQSYEIRLEGNTDGNYTNYFTVWIDWNQDGDWNDVGEMYPIGSIINSNGTDGKQAIGNIAVPADAALGTTTMRVIKNYGTSPTNPCGTYSFGQGEDYTIEVAGPAAADCTWTVHVWDNGNFGDEVDWTLKDAGGATLLQGGGYGLGYDDTKTVVAEGPLTFTISAIGFFNDNTPNFTVSNDNGIVVSGQLFGGDSATHTDLDCGDLPPPPPAFNCDDQFVNSNNFQNGSFFGGDTNQRLATDIVVGNDGFTGTGMELNVFVDGATDLDFFFTFYEDAGGLPGAQLTSGFGEVITSEPVGNAFGFDVYRFKVKFDNPFAFAANTNYWIEVESDGLAWETTTASVLGSQLAFINDSTSGAWTIGTSEVVFKLLCEELGVSDLSSYDFAYYPNPVKDVLNISSQKGVKEVSIFNLAGQKVVNNAKLNQGQINLSSLTPGTYVFRVTLEGGQVETFKIVKK